MRIDRALCHYPHMSVEFNWVTKSNKKLCYPITKIIPAHYLRMSTCNIAHRFITKSVQMTNPLVKL